MIQANCLPTWFKGAPFPFPELVVDVIHARLQNCHMEWSLRGARCRSSDAELQARPKQPRQDASDEKGLQSSPSTPPPSSEDEFIDWKAKEDRNRGEARPSAGTACELATGTACCGEGSETRKQTREQEQSTRTRSIQAFLPPAKSFGSEEIHR